AGSIEMGSAEDWQSQFEGSLSDLDVLILNPRRDEWDNSWEQSIDHALFRGQVEWELAGLEGGAGVRMDFGSGSTAAVRLLELGLCARSGRLVVACPTGFWRRGNVEIVCQRYGVPLLESLPDLVAEVRRRLEAEQVAAPDRGGIQAFRDV